LSEVDKLRLTSRGGYMLSIEEYIARRKREDKLNEFDINERI